VVEQMSQTKTDTIQKMIDQVTQEYEVSSAVFHKISRFLIWSYTPRWTGFRRKQSGITGVGILTGWMPFPSFIQQCQALKGIEITDTNQRKLPTGFIHS